MPDFRVFKKPFKCIALICKGKVLSSPQAWMSHECYFMSWLGNRLMFFDYGSKRIGRRSFINRAKYISELIPYEWTNLSPPAFKPKINWFLFYLMSSYWLILFLLSFLYANHFMCYNGAGNIYLLTYLEFKTSTGTLELSDNNS